MEKFYRVIALVSGNIVDISVDTRCRVGISKDASLRASVDIPRREDIHQISVITLLYIAINYFCVIF